MIGFELTLLLLGCNDAQALAEKAKTEFETSEAKKSYHGFQHGDVVTYTNSTGYEETDVVDMIKTDRKCDKATDQIFIASAEGDDSYAESTGACKSASELRLAGTRLLQKIAKGYNDYQKHKNSN